jgi:UDP:flavonoid glycosyltransferase YjiC (YdhE family)
MRMLFVSLGSVGHTYPMIPLAVAARRAGHDVHWATGDTVHPALRANGLRPFRPANCFYELYADDLEPELARLEPELVVHGWGVPGAAEAARRVGVPSLWHGFGRLVPDGIGIEPPTKIALPHVDICPPSLQDKEFRATATRIELRPVPYAEPGELPKLTTPLVYLTFGTAFGTAELLTTAIEGLALLGVRVVVATGRVRPGELRDLPDDVVVHDWLPQADLLPHVDLVVHHGGSGTMLGALSAGVPQLVLPQGADQFANADAVHDAGVGLRLRPDDVSVAAVAQQANALRRGDHRAAARAVAAEIAGMPSPDDVVGQLAGYRR